MNLFGIYINNIKESNSWKLMSSFIHKLENYNSRKRGSIRMLFSYMEYVILLITFFLVYEFSNEILNLELRFSSKDIFLFSVIVTISVFIKLKITSQARLPRTQRYRYIIIDTVQIQLITLLIVILLKFILKLDTIPLYFIIVFLPVFFFLSLVYKLTGYHFLKVYRASGYNLHNVIIIADAFSDQVIERLLNQKEWGFKIKGIITKSKLIIKKYGSSIPILSEKVDLMIVLGKKNIDEIIYCKATIDNNQIKKVRNICDEIGVIFRLQSSVSPIDHLNFQFKTLNEPRSIVLVDGPSNHYSILIKTILDYYFSIFAMVVLSPLFFLIAIIIKLDSKGPIFFTQERVGLHGRKFTLYKFRTMVADAEDRLHHLIKRNEADGPVFKIKDDPRITSFGKFLRKTSLDELPQLQNVIKGEMSLIGPRPPLASEVKQYEPWQLRRLSVKPGITCTWQIVPNRNEIKFENWMKMDLQYIDDWSLAKDAKLFFKTLTVFFFAWGR